MESGQLDTAKPTVLTPKFDWYQTDTYVVVTVMVKNVKKEELNVEFDVRSLKVSIQKPDEDYHLDLRLSHAIRPENSSKRIMSTKIECKLIKDEGVRWNVLQGEDSTPAPAASQASSSQETTQKYPSSAHYTRDWDKVVADIKEEEKNEKPEGEAALNQLFQQIYSDGSDEIKKAMNKSFVESGGTVLSTDWSKIGEKKVEIQPPDGMEYKKYEK